MDYERTYATVDLDAIRYNIQSVRARVVSSVKVAAVIKANAYGHGAVAVGRFLEPYVDYFCVAAVEEAAELREAGIQIPVLILGYTSPKQYPMLLKADGIPAIYSYETALALEEAAAKAGVKAKIHFALDTGMTRIGFSKSAESIDTMEKIAALPHLIVEGLFSHFSCADMADKSYCDRQIEVFEWFCEKLKERNVEIPVKHLCNSAGIMEFTDYRYNMVRAGIIIYGLWPSDEVQFENLSIKPALSWYSHVIHVQTAEAGVGVSYGAAYVTKKPARIATVSIGYADGYPRSLSGKGYVLIHGKKAPILGRVCMDQMMVDVSEIPDVKEEDTVTLIGTDGEETITMEELGRLSGRFNYELACDIGRRVKRIYNSDEARGSSDNLVKI